MLGLSAKAGPWRVEQADLTALCGAGAGPASIHEVGAWLPDLSDAATVGCLLALVREVWGWPHAFACHDETGWCVPSGETGCCVELQDEAGDGERYNTEAAALVAALEAAP
jgi:hypothetical protein